MMTIMTIMTESILNRNFTNDNNENYDRNAYIQHTS